ncbi:MAG: GIY-YIG nuclease family protein [Candidatus Berkelbacteria bacterium]|nr:GIY-YIG nuclease family protein [Candidatus Berkelbacteria bacterium]
MKNIIYILFSKNYQKTYVGVTNNLANRLIQHNKGCNAYTKKYKPWKIIYTEEFETENEVLNRERYLKSHAGRKFIKSIIEKTTF